MLTRMQWRPPLITFCRKYTTTPYDGTFKKLRAYPFRMDPETAQRLMARWGSVMAGGSQRLSSALATFFPSMDYYRPMRFSAVYFPAWIINADIDAEVTQGQMRKCAQALFHNTYVPGSNAPLLSVAPLWTRDLDSVEPEPFTESLLTQYGEEVHCILFSISPFSVIDIPASSTDSLWSVTEDLKVSPSSIKPNLFSACPVLLPLYLAQYKVTRPEFGQDTVTLFIRAHNKSEGVMAQGLVQEEPLSSVFKMLNNLGLMKKMDLKADVLDFSDNDNPRVRLGSVSLRPVQDSVNAITDWLDDHLCSYDNIEKLANMGQLESDDDPRIREMTTEEQESMGKYFSVASEIMLLARMSSAISQVQDRRGMVLSLSKDRILPKLERVEDASLTVETRLEHLEERRKALRPRWWVEWEAASNSKSEPSVQK